MSRGWRLVRLDGPGCRRLGAVAPDAPDRVALLDGGDPQLPEVAAEIGFGRRQVLSEWGRADAAERWHDGDYGPAAPMARSTSNGRRLRHGSDTSTTPSGRTTSAAARVSER